MARNSLMTKRCGIPARSIPHVWCLRSTGLYRLGERMLNTSFEIAHFSRLTKACVLHHANNRGGPASAT